MAGQMPLKVSPEEDNGPHCLRVRGCRSLPPALIQQSKGAPDDDKDIQLKKHSLVSSFCLEKFTCSHLWFLPKKRGETV